MSSSSFFDDRWQRHCVMTLIWMFVVVNSGQAQQGAVGANFTHYRYIQYLQHAPRITSGPRDQRVIDNGVASFICRATGNPVPEIYWRRTAAGRRLTYTAVGGSSAGSSSTSSSNGGSSGGRQQLRYTVVVVPTAVHSMVSSASVGSVLRVEPVKAARGDDDSEVECVADNGVGEPAVASARLQIYPVDGHIPAGYPRIIEGPKLKAVEKDRNTVLNCTATGSPEPTITWLKDFTPVDMTDSRIKLLVGGSLQIQRSQESDEGKYECIAENNYGSAYSYGANLYVRVRRVPPHFSILPEGGDVPLGGSVNLTCVAVGSPMPLVRWLLGKIELQTTAVAPPAEGVDSTTSLLGPAYSSASSSGGGNSAPIGKNVLMLTDVRQTATYTCVAASELGNIEHDVEIKVKEPTDLYPPAVIRIVSDSIVLVRLSPVSSSWQHGPSILYYVVVVPAETRTAPDDVIIDELVRSAGDPTRDAWIAARYDGPVPPPSELLLGDGSRTGDRYINRPLRRTHLYRSFVRAIGRDGSTITSGYSTILSTATRGPFAPNDSPETDDVIPSSATSAADGGLPLWIVFPLCAAIIIVLAFAALVAVVRRRKWNRKSRQQEPTKMFLLPAEIPTHPSDPVELRRLHFQTQGMASHPPIPISDFPGHVSQLKSNDGHRFTIEYESIEPGQPFTWDASNLDVNKQKNRYANVVAYDHSRVVLQSLDGITGSDYINANYIDGYRKQNAYIATQGPLPETFGDFWRMVWEQRSTTIVMLTRLEERGRIKCDQYWPNRGTYTYGAVHVTLIDSAELATYTIRTFLVSRDGCSDRCEVRHFQFLAWPDHGVPSHPTPLLMFMRRVKALHQPESGPIIVHCSAGVGRTGAVIVIDAMLERVRHERTVDVYGHVTVLRSQRNYMVQTEDQYVFVHDALVDAIQYGATEIPARALYGHIQRLTCIEPGETSTGIELEFKRLNVATSMSDMSLFVSACLPYNKFKNRLVNVLPYESTRVCLQPIRGVDGSDYINASFIDGYRYRKAYIATQAPLAATVDDLWRMMWEHNSTIIVMLTKLREMGRDKCHQYWPTERSARYQYFVVDPTAEYNMPQYILREFKVTDARDGQSRTIRQFQFMEWPEQGVPKSGEGFVDFVGQVHKTKEQFGQDGPITVHCSAGVGRTGLFIALSTVLERMRYETIVDLFQTVRMLRSQRPSMVQTEDQYAFCYRAALDYLGSFDHYAT